MSPCKWIEGPNGEQIHLNLGRSRGRRMRCGFCGGKYNQADGKLCDFPVGHEKTCDAAMCASCSRRLGYQRTAFGTSGFTQADTIDVCPIHRDKAVVEAGKIREAQP